MSTSDTKPYLKTALVYLLTATFCALFGAIYERFSHGVYSYHMLYAFAYPLLLGTLPSLILALLARPLPAPMTRTLHRCAIATFTVGSILQGVLEIYGTTNRLTTLYFPTATLLLLCSTTTYLFRPTPRLPSQGSCREATEGSSPIPSQHPLEKPEEP